MLDFSEFFILILVILVIKYRDLSVRHQEERGYCVGWCYSSMRYNIDLHYVLFLPSFTLNEYVSFQGERLLFVDLFLISFSKGSGIKRSKKGVQTIFIFFIHWGSLFGRKGYRDFQVFLFFLIPHLWYSFSTSELLFYLLIAVIWAVLLNLFFVSFLYL